MPWIWTSIVLSVGATAALSIHRLRRSPPALYLACAGLIVAIEIEKGMGTIMPGFIPEPWGRIVEYSATWVEWTVSLGILALGCFVFTVLAKAAIPIESGRVRAPAILPCRCASATILPEPVCNLCDQGGGSPASLPPCRGVGAGPGHRGS